MNFIVDLSIFISIFLLIYLLIIQEYISMTLLVTLIGPIFDSSTSNLDLLHINELLLILGNILLIIVVRETTNSMVGCNIIETRMKIYGTNIEFT